MTRSNTSTGDQFEQFDLSTVSNAPTGPGLYAWYGRLKLGPADWNYHHGAGSDDLVDALMRHTRRHRQAPLEVKGRTGELLRFSGALNDVTFGNSYKVDDEMPGTLLNENWLTALEEENTREFLVDVLQAAIPYFEAPLYIGLSKDGLRKRLSAHASDFRNVSTVMRKAADREEARRVLLNANRKKFASRAVALGFSEENLVVYTLELGKMAPAGTSRTRIEAVAEIAEHFLNRWFRPKLGRR